MNFVKGGEENVRETLSSKMAKLLHGRCFNLAFLGYFTTRSRMRLREKY